MNSEIVCMPPSREAGFSLLEMAMVMLIVGLLLGGLLSALGDTAETSRRSEIEADLEMIQEALYGFAQANGRLPCPATTASAGQEAYLGAGVCTAWHGFVPMLALGIQGTVNDQGLIMDPWGTPIRYSVSSHTMPSTAHAFTSTAGMSEVFAAGSLAPGVNLICVSATTACDATVLGNPVPAVIFSVGANARFHTSAIEIENINSNVAPPNWGTVANNNFVSAPYAEDGTLAFDDTIVWLSTNILFSRLVAAGQLP
jgi:prepilin-type N-terminal cleavage/methylation domain-containing protein